MDVGNWSTDCGGSWINGGNHAEQVAGKVYRNRISWRALPVIVCGRSLDVG